MVIDASMTLSWFLPDEATARTQTLFAAATTPQTHVSPIWPAEIANSLLVNERRRRITASEVADIAIVLSDMHIIVDGASLTDALRLVDLARRYGLSVYDASYLDLAMRLGLPPAGNDVDLSAAAAAAGVAVL